MKIKTAVAILVLLASFRMVWAQQPLPTDPGAIQKHDSDTIKYFELEKKLEQLRQQQASENSKKSGRQTREASSANTRFLLQHVNVNHSELLPQAKIHAVLQKYEGRTVSLADLQKLIDEINQLYERKGYRTARAILPAQRIANGEVKVTLVEGHVGKVLIGDQTRTRDTFILRSVGIQPGKLLRTDDLQRNLVFLNDTTDLKVKAVLEPGASFGTSDVNLRVEEPHNQRSMLFFDNGGRDGVGNNRVGFVERYASVLGLRDPFQMGLTWAAGTLDGFTSYNFPLDNQGTRLGFNFDYNRIRVISGPTAGFGISGTSRDLGLKLFHPFVETSRVRLSLSLSADSIKSHLQSQNIPLSDTLVHSFGVATDALILDRHGLWSASETINMGFHNLGGRRSFFKSNTSFVRVQNLAWGFTGVVRLTGQASAWNYLPPVEQFQVGGMATVRGYPEGRQIGDRGYAGSAELQIPPPFQNRRIHGSKFGQKIKEAIFFDNGAVYDGMRRFNRPPGDDRYLTSAGSGLIFNLSNFFSGRVDVGFPLRNTEKIPHCRVQFFLQSSPPLVGDLWKTAKAWWGPW